MELSLRRSRFLSPRVERVVFLRLPEAKGVLQGLGRRLCFALRAPVVLAEGVRIRLEI